MIKLLSGRLRYLAILTLLMGFTALADDPTLIATASAMARATKKVSPDYPMAAKQLNVTGQQEVSIVVDLQGGVEDAKVIKGNAMFTQASLAAARQWKFTPLTKDGQPIRFSAVIIFNYAR